MQKDFQSRTNKTPTATIDASNILQGPRARAPSTPAKTAGQVPSDDTVMGLVRANPVSTLPRKRTQTLTTLVLALSHPNPDLNPKAEYTQWLIEHTKTAIMLAYFPVDENEQRECQKGTTISEYAQRLLKKKIDANPLFGEEVKRCVNAMPGNPNPNPNPNPRPNPNTKPNPHPNSNLGLIRQTPRFMWR